MVREREGGRREGGREGRIEGEITATRRERNKTGKKPPIPLSKSKFSDSKM